MSQNRRGRPSRRDSFQRTMRFAELVAKDDTRLREAARSAGVDPWRALDLLSDKSFRKIVDNLDERAAA